MLRIAWTEHESNEELLRKIKTTRRMMLIIRKKQLKFFRIRK